MDRGQRSGLWSVCISQDWPYKYGRKTRVAWMTPRHSRSVVEYWRSVGVNNLLWKQMTLSVPSWIWDKTLPIPVALASDVIRKGRSNRGKAIIGAVHSAFFRHSNADCCRSVHWNGVFLCVSSCKGRAISEK